MRHSSSASPSSPSSSSSFHLSNLQVIALLLVLGALLIGATWVVAKDFGRVPVSLWDICTSVLPGSDAGASASESTAATLQAKP